MNNVNDVTIAVFSSYIKLKNYDYECTGRCCKVYGNRVASILWLSTALVATHKNTKATISSVFKVARIEAVKPNENPKILKNAVQLQYMHV